MSLRFEETKLDSKPIWKVPTLIGFNERPVGQKPLPVVCIIDTETTGLDTATDELIELGYLLIEYDHKTGLFYDVVKKFNEFQEPSKPLDPEITRITGITDEMVKGKTINWDEVAADVRKARLLVAHNAQFDRKMLERSHDVFKDSHWACSVNDIDWSAEGEKGRSQEWLVYKLAESYYDAHRAVDDVNALAFLLSHRSVTSSETYFNKLLATARKDQYIIRALGSTFSEKDDLKKMGCRWDGDGKVWWIKASDEDRDQVEQQMREAAPNSVPQVKKINALDRYSVRDV